MLSRVQNRNVLWPFNGELACCDIPGAVIWLEVFCAVPSIEWPFARYAFDVLSSSKGTQVCETCLATSIWRLNLLVLKSPVLTPQKGWYFSLAHFASLDVMVPNKILLSNNITKFASITPLHQSHSCRKCDHMFGTNTLFWLFGLFHGSWIVTTWASPDVMISQESYYATVIVIKYHMAGSMKTFMWFREHDLASAVLHQIHSSILFCIQGLASSKLRWASGMPRMPTHLLHHGPKNRTQESRKNMVAIKGPRL